MNGRVIALTAAQAAGDKKAEDICVLDVHKISPVTDFFVICSGRSNTQIRAIAESVMEAVSGLGQRYLRKEGNEDAGWVLIDFGDAVVHVFDEREREFYKLESLWKDAEKLSLA